eukprot:4648115-Amphidinium_carterae.1
MSYMLYRLHVFQPLGTIGMSGQYGYRSTVCCRHSRYTPKSGWNPRAGYPELECFPVRFQRGEWWQDVDNVLVQDASITYCPGYGLDSVYRNLTQADLIHMARENQNRRGGVLDLSAVTKDPKPRPGLWQSYYSNRDTRHLAEFVSPYPTTDPECE